MEGDAVGAEFGQLVDGVDTGERGPGRVTEYVPGLPTDGPESEAELVLAGRGGGHDLLPFLRGLGLVVVVGYLLNPAVSPLTS
jgi:hypothetical protein